MVFDIEIMGMNCEGGFYYEGYWIIEIGVVEIINCKFIGWYFYVYLKLDCDI